MKAAGAFDGLPRVSLILIQALQVVCTENLNPNVIMMKPTKDRV